MLETLIALPVVLVLGLSVVQWAFIYEARAVLDHATMMSARAGALHHAEVTPMRKAFARALLALELDDANVAAFELANLSARSDSRLHGRMRILNPTQGAFRDHARRDKQGRQFLPFRDLDRGSRRIGEASGLNRQDATLLRVQWTYGVPLNVPYANTVILQAAKGLSLLSDGFNVRERVMLESGRLPVTTTATLRMQSRAYAGTQFPRQSELTTVARAPN